MTESKKSNLSESHSSYLLGCYVLLSLISDFSVFPLFSVIGSGDAVFLVIGVIGLLVGQCAFVSVLAGLAGRHWVRGFAIATWSALTGTVALLSGQFLAERYSIWISSAPEALWVIYLVPVVLMVLALPMLVFRFVTGWYLSKSKRVEARTPLSIQDMLLLTAVVGTLIFMSRTPMEMWQIDASDFWPGFAGFALAFFIISGVVILPAALIALWRSDASDRVPHQIMFAVAVVLSLGLFAAASAAPIAGGVVFVVLSGAFFSFFLGIGALRSAGFRLRGYRDHSEASQNAKASETQEEERDGNEKSAQSDLPDEGPPVRETSIQMPEVQHATIADSRWATRLSAVSLLLLAIIGAAARLAFETVQEGILSGFSEISQKAAMEGGDLAIWKNEVHSAKFGPSASNEDLQAVQDFDRLVRLDLSRTQVNDQIVETIGGLETLEQLDVSYTGMSARGVGSLLQQMELANLKLAGIPLGPGELSQLLDRATRLKSLGNVDISECGVTFEDLKRSWKKLPLGVGLRGYGLTDEQVSELLRIAPKSSLDLSENKLAGYFLKEVHSPMHLLLVGNPLEDGAFRKAANSGLSMLALELGRNPELTAGSLPDILALDADYLTFGEESFTESQLAGESLDVSGLTFKGSWFTGEKMKFGGDYLTQLDLSYSGVTQAGLKNLRAQIHNVYGLDLSNTGIDDASLPVIAMMNPQEVNLCNTRVSAEGLCMGDLKHCATVHVSIRQFNTEEIQRIQKVINIQLGNRAKQWP